jgi:hypothetical protein
MNSEQPRQGIYIVANDRVTEQAIALVNSIRYVDSTIPIVLIPFDDRYQTVFSALTDRHRITLFPDLGFLETLTHDVATIFSEDFLALPNKMRKLAVWFGPLDRFLYIDTDIIVFDQMKVALDSLEDYDFICCDYHHSGRGIQDIFSPLVLEQDIFTASDLQDIFNSGFWGSKKSALAYETLKTILQDCAMHRPYFDFSRKTTDQPILNYLVLKTMPKRLNLVRLPDWSAGSWAGSPHFQQRGQLLYDGDRPLKYLHWAGTPMRAGGPYRELWETYRYLQEERPDPTEQAPTQRFTGQITGQITGQKLIDRMKLVVKQLLRKM